MKNTMDRERHKQSDIYFFIYLITFITLRESNMEFHVTCQPFKLTDPLLERGPDCTSKQNTTVSCSAQLHMAIVVKHRIA